MRLTWEAASDDELPKLEAELLAWVNWAASVYPSLRAALRPCWTQHPDVLRELNAYGVWWENIYHPREGTPEDEGGAAAAWHKELETLVHHLHAAMKSCRDDHCWRDTKYGSLEGSQLKTANPNILGTLQLWRAPYEERPRPRHPAAFPIKPGRGGDFTTPPRMVVTRPPHGKGSPPRARPKRRTAPPPDVQEDGHDE